MPITKVISGGQTGVDRAALDVAMALISREKSRCDFDFHPHAPEGFLEVGGWCPLDFKSEDGRIPTHYPLTPCDSLDYNVRTFKNVQGSDATLIICTNMPTGGTAKTIQFARELGKPYTILHPDTGAMAAQEHNFQAWVEFNNVKVLNIAGPRESKCPGIYLKASELLMRLLPLVCG